MSQIKFSGLPAGTVPADSDIFCAVQGGNSRRVTAAQVLDYIFSDHGQLLDIANGGTGADNRADALNALLPNQASHAGEVLTTDGAAASWAAAGGTPPGIDSPNGTAVVSLSSGDYHVDVNPAGSNAFTQPQTVTATVAGNGYAAHLCDGTANAAIVGRGTPAGAGGEGRIGCLNQAANFVHSSFTGQVTLCDATFSVNANGLPIFSGAGLDVRVALGFFGAALVGQQPANVAMTDATGGAVATTLNAVAGTGDDATINGNLASLNARLAELRALLLAYGLGS